MSRRRLTRYAAGKRLDIAETGVYGAFHESLAHTLEHARRQVLGHGSLVAAIDPAQLNAAAPTWEREISFRGRDVLVPLYEQTFDAQTAKTAAEVPAEVRNRLSERYWEDRLRVLNTTIDTVFDQIRTEISAGVAAGEDADQLTARVARIMQIDAVNDAGQPRYAGDVARIARTETALAYNKATYDAAVAQAQLHDEQLTKEWIATLDERTRETHDVADGQQVGLFDPFHVGGALLAHPGDPDGPPQETINCRCTVGIDEANPALSAAVGDQVSPDYPGGMVALRPADPQQYTVPGGHPANEMHLTLAFLGDDVTQLDEPTLDHIVDAARIAAASVAPIDATIAGAGQLGPDRAQVLLLNGAGIADAHDILTGNLCADCIPEQHAPFIPHMTLGYGDLTGSGVDVAEPGTPVRFDAITVDLGKNQIRIPLTGPTDADIATAMGDPMGVTAAVSGIPEQLREYWTHGKGAAKIRWGVGGDFNRCRRALRKYVPAGHTLDGLCANLHSIATGKYPGAGPGHGHAASGEFEMSVETLVAAVAGSASLPVADRDTAWNGDDATGRILAHCKRGDGVDVACVAQGHLWRHSDRDPTTKAAWSLPFADVIGGKLVIVPQGIASVAGGHGLRRLSGASSSDVSAMKARACAVYAAVRKRYDDWPECPFSRGPNPTHDTRRNDAMSADAVNADALSAADFPVTAPVMPPADWFTDPQLDGPTPITVTNEGRVFGHLADHRMCHTGFGDQCVAPPRSATNYAYFRTGEVAAADGSRIPVGQITAGGGHADLRLGWVAAKAHYDDVSTAVADVAAGEDDHGIWLAGAVRPNASPEQIRILMGSRPSGDWRPIGGSRELIGAHSVNVPGYPVARRAIIADATTWNESMVIVGEQVQYLVASGCADCEQTEVTEKPISLVARRLAAARIQAAVNKVHA